MGFHAASCFLSVQPGTLTFSHRLVASPSYGLASSLAT
jgi:hypothetical protein